MKRTITAILLLISLSVFSQKKSNGSIAMPYGDTSKIIHQSFTEEEMVNLFQLLQIARRSDLIWNSDYVTTKGARMMSAFADSLMNVYSKQSELWHPAPPPAKQDSTNKKKP